MGIYKHFEGETPTTLTISELAVFLANLTADTKNDIVSIDATYKTAYSWAVRFTSYHLNLEDSIRRFINGTE